MIVIDGIEMRTEAQWARKNRAVLKRQLSKGLKREWRSSMGLESAIFYREDQTRQYNAKELRHARSMRRAKDAERKSRLSCKCCGEYVGRDIGRDKLCDFCAKPHTAWQWMNYKHFAPRKDAVPEGKRPIHWNPETDTWVESEKEWFYYTAEQVVPVPEKRYERLKALYIKRFGGWETIDLEHTDYDGHAWW